MISRILLILDDKVIRLSNCHAECMHDLTSMAGSWDSWQKAGHSSVLKFLIKVLFLRHLAFLQSSSGVLPGESHGGTKQQGHFVEAEDVAGRWMLLCRTVLVKVIGSKQPLSPNVIEASSFGDTEETNIIW